MLHNGYIKCTINNKKTKNYQIRIEDLFAYIDKVEQLNPEIMLPTGIFSSKKYKAHNSKLAVIAHCVIHQKPPDDFKDWLADEWFDVDEMLSSNDVSELIGYTEKTIQDWEYKKVLKNAWHQNHIFTTRTG